MSLCLPWLFCGLLIYGYTAIRSDAGFHGLAAIRFLLGKDSYLYYLSVLLILQVIFYLLRKLPRTVLLWICLGISWVSILFSAASLTTPLLEKLYLTDYLNICNWCGFFALGFAAQQWQPEKLLAGIKRLWLPAAALWGVLLVTGYFTESRFGYFSWLGFPMELCSSILLLRVGLALRNCDWLSALGKYTFPIYLLHIQVIPITAVFLGNYSIGALVSPAVTYAATWGALWCVNKCCHILKVSRIAKLLIGIR